MAAFRPLITNVRARATDQGLNTLQEKSDFYGGNRARNVNQLQTLTEIMRNRYGVFLN